jgi:iron complex outermembrane receptor protein
MPDPEELYIGLQRIPTMMTPTLTNWVGNPSLDPVRNNQVDLGLKYSTDRFFINSSVFYSDLRDYITLVAIPDPDGPGMGNLPAARGYDNVKARIWGGEISGQVSLPFDLYLLANLAYTEGKNRDSGEPLAEMPPLSGSLGLRYDIDTFFVEVTERFADKQDRVDDQLDETETSGWGVTDIKTGLNADRWSVYAGVNNLFDKFYHSHLSYQRDPFRSGVKVPEVGAFAYVTVAYRY